MKRRLALFGVRTAFRTVGRVAPGPTARWAEALFCRPPRAPVRPHEEAFLASGRRLDIATSGGTLAAWEWGTGPLVLLVHGWGSRAARFRVLGPLLVEAGFRVVAYDHPAHGRSPGKRTSLPESTAVLLEVTHRLGPLHAAVGHSFGGAAIAVALSRGLSLRRAVLIAPYAAPPEILDQYARIVALPPAVTRRMQQNLERRLRLRIGDLYVPKLIGPVTTPGLIIHDRRDEDIPFTDGEAIARAWPGAKFIATEGLGHHAIMRDAQVARRIVAFVSEDIAR
jgi:pimeloyl-ACP methyl ester carboxylesterase